MLISNTHFRFPFSNGNFEYSFDMRMVSIMQLRFFQSLLQIVHLMNFKSRTRTLEVGDRKKMLRAPCWKEKKRSAASAGKIHHRKNCVIKECVLTRCSFYKKPNFDLEL